MVIYLILPADTRMRAWYGDLKNRIAARRAIQRACYGENDD